MSAGDSGVVADSSAKGEETDSLRLIRDVADRPLLPDLMDDVSPLSLSPLEIIEFLGLSVRDPGIRDRREFLNDRVDSFVSDLIIGGPVCEGSFAPLPLEPVPPSLELVFPIAQSRGCGQYAVSGSSKCVKD